MLYNTESNNDFFCEPDNKFNPSEHASNKNLIYSMQFTCFLFFSLQTATKLLSIRETRQII